MSNKKPEPLKRHSSPQTTVDLRNSQRLPARAVTPQVTQPLPDRKNTAPNVSARQITTIDQNELRRGLTPRQRTTDLQHLLWPRFHMVPKRKDDWVHFSGRTTIVPTTNGTRPSNPQHRLANTTPPLRSRPHSGNLRKRTPLEEKLEARASLPPTA